METRSYGSITYIVPTIKESLGSSSSKGQPDTSRIIADYTRQFTGFSSRSNTVYNGNGELIGTWADNHPRMFVYVPLSRGINNDGDYAGQGSRGMRKNFNRFGMTCTSCKGNKCSTSNYYGGTYKLLLFRSRASACPWSGLTPYRGDLDSDCRMSSSWDEGDIPMFRKQAYWNNLGEIYVGGVACNIRSSLTPSSESTRLRYKATITESNWMTKVTQSRFTQKYCVCVGITENDCYKSLSDVITANNSDSTILNFVTNVSMPDYGSLADKVTTPDYYVVLPSFKGIAGIAGKVEYKSPIQTNTTVTISTEHVPDYLSGMDADKYSPIKWIKDFIDNVDTLPSAYHTGTFATAMKGIILNVPEIKTGTIDNAKMWLRKAFNEAVHTYLNYGDYGRKIRECFVSDSKLIEFEIATGLLPGVMERMGVPTTLGSADVGTRFFNNEQYGFGDKSTLTWDDKPIFKHIVRGDHADDMPYSSDQYDNRKKYIDNSAKSDTSSSMTVKLMRSGYLEDVSKVVAIREACQESSSRNEGTRRFIGTYRVYINGPESSISESSYLNGYTQDRVVWSCCGNHNQGQGYNIGKNHVQITIRLGSMIEMPYKYASFDLSAIEANIDSIVKGFYGQSGTSYGTGPYTPVSGSKYAWTWRNDSDTTNFVTGCQNGKVFIPDAGATKKSVELYRVLGANKNLGKVCGAHDNAGGKCRCASDNNVNAIGNNIWVAASDRERAFCHMDSNESNGVWYDDLIVPNDQISYYEKMGNCGLGYYLIEDGKNKDAASTDITVYKDGSYRYILLQFEFNVTFTSKTPPKNVTSEGLCPYFVKNKSYFIPDLMLSRWLSNINKVSFTDHFKEGIKSCLTPSCLVMYHAYNRLLGLEPVCLYENPFNAVMIHNEHNVGSGHNAYYSDYIMSTENGVPFSGEVDNKFGNYLDTIAKDAVNDMAIKGPKDDVAIVVHLPTDAKELTKITKCELSLFSDLSAKSRLIYVTELERNSEKYENAPAINLVDTNRGNVNNVLILTPKLINTSGNSANQALQLASLGAITVPRFIVDSDTNKKTKTFTFDSVLMNIYMTNNPAVNPKPEWNKATNKASNRYLELHFDTSKTQDELKYIKGKELKSEFD